MTKKKIDWNKKQVLEYKSDVTKMVVISNGKHDPFSFEATVIHSNHPDRKLLEFCPILDKEKFIPISEPIMIVFTP